MSKKPKAFTLWERKTYNTRRAYVLQHVRGDILHPLQYVPTHFLALKKGDIFIVTSVEGTPVSNYDGGVVRVATGDAYEDDGGVWCITWDSWGGDLSSLLDTTEVLRRIQSTRLR